MRKHEKKTSIILDRIKRHISINIKLYLRICVFFLIGIIIGVIFVNNIEANEKEEMSVYLDESINKLKSNYQIDSVTLLKNLIGSNIIFTFFIWFMGCTVIGIPIVYLMVFYKGFSLSYTISIIIFSLGIGKGSLFCFLSMFLQNLIIIPTTFALAISGIKLYKSIIKDRRKENIKVEIIRHTIFSLFMLILLIIGSIVETYISSKLVCMCINYI